MAQILRSHVIFVVQSLANRFYILKVNINAGIALFI